MRKLIVALVVGVIGVSAFAASASADECGGERGGYSTRYEQPVYREHGRFERQRFERDRIEHARFEQARRGRFERGGRR